MKLVDWIERQPVRIGFGQRNAGLAAFEILADPDSVEIAPGLDLPAATGFDAGVMTAADKTRLDGLQNTTVAVDPAHFDSRAQVAATAITDPQVNHLSTAGHGAAGDGGAAIYRRSVLEPAHPGKVQSADGAWWELVPGAAGATPEQFGATDGLTGDNADALQDWFDYLVISTVRRGVASGEYRVDATVTLSDPDDIFIDARGAKFTTANDTLVFDLNGRADPTYSDNESRQNFVWIGGEIRCNFAGPTKATAFRMLGMRKAILEPYKCEGFHAGIVLGGKDTIRLADTKFFNNDIDVLFPPWSIEGGPLLVQLRNLHHSHGGKTTPCVRSYVPLNDSLIESCSYNLGDASSAIAVDLEKVVLLGVSGGAGTWTAGETVTGDASGATMVIDEVYDHPFPFAVAQNTRWLVGHTRTGSFTPGEGLTGQTTAATAILANDPAYLVENPNWKLFRFTGANHFEAGSGANGATGIRVRDRIGGAPTFNFDIDIGGLALNGGGSVGIDLDGVQDTVIRGYFAQQAGNTVLKTDPDCMNIAIVPPFRELGATIDLNGMSRDELDLGAFDRHLTAPLNIGATTTLVAGPTAATRVVMGSSYLIAGIAPRAYELLVKLRATTAAAGTNVRYRSFTPGETAAAAKNSLRIDGWADNEHHTTKHTVHPDAAGDWEYDGQNSGGGTVTATVQLLATRF